jgi:hypothetical protein
MKWKKWFFILWAVIIIATVIYSLHFRVNISKVSMQDLDGYQVVIIDSREEQDPYFRTEGVRMRSLYDEADIVVEVTATNDRKAEYQAVLTKVKVNKVYKGDKAIEDNDIYVYEYVSIDKIDDKITMQIMDVNNLMKEGNRYYLLLDFLERPEGYRYDEISSKTYLYVNVPFGKWRDTEPVYAMMPEDGSQIWDTYGNIKEIDAFMRDEEYQELYEKNRNEFFEIIG